MTRLTTYRLRNCSDALQLSLVCSLMLSSTRLFAFTSRNCSYALQHSKSYYALKHGDLQTLLDTNANTRLDTTYATGDPLHSNVHFEVCDKGEFQKYPPVTRTIPTLALQQLPIAEKRYEEPFNDDDNKYHEYDD